MQIFEETQGFNQWWIWLLLIGVACIPFYGVVQQVILGNPIGNRPISNTGMIIFAVSMAAFLLFFFLLKLNTTIDQQGIKMSFFPLTKKEISWDQIETTEVINYGFVGGWGIRYFTKYGTVYNTKGNMGLLITLKEGEQFVIGTQRPDELKSFLKKR